MSSFHSLRVSNIDKLTSKAVIVSFEIPPTLMGDFNFMAGQYISLQTQIAGSQVRRSYSICSVPQSGVLQVGIKQVPEGVFSTYATQQLAVGDFLEVSVPEGRFTLAPELNESTIVGIAAGSGITPIMSIIKSVLQSDSNSQFVLLYGNKSPEEAMFYEDLNNARKRKSSKIKNSLGIYPSQCG